MFAPQALPDRDGQCDVFPEFRNSSKVEEVGGAGSFWAQVGAHKEVPVRRSDQDVDRGEPGLRLSDSGAPVGLQQEHCTAHLPAQGLTGEETSDRLPAAGEGVAIGRASPQRTLGD